MKISTAPDPELDAFIREIAREYPGLDNASIYHGALLSDKLPFTDEGVWEYLDFLKYLSIYYTCENPNV